MYYENNNILNIFVLRIHSSIFLNILEKTGIVMTK